MKSQENRSNLKPFFEPGSVAVFGSLKDGMGLGYGSIRNMLQFGFTGRIYPINPSYASSEVLGFKAYSTIDEVEDPIDTAIIITPPPTVPTIVEQCARKGVKAAIVVSENFAEANEDGARLQRQLVDIARRAGIRIIGPNTVGVLNTANGFISTPYFVAYKSVWKGNVAYCSQTGFVSAGTQPLEDRAYPISKICDVGNKCDVNEVDLLDYLADDPETKVIAMHLEDIKDGRSFMSAARRAVARKPLLIFKPARSEAGARASASHTGSLAGNDLIYDNAFKQVGAIRINSWQEYWELPKVLAYQPLPKGNRVAIITFTGGAGVVAVDVATEAGLVMARLSDATIDKLRKLSPRLASNPVDLGPYLSVSDNPFSDHEGIMRAVLDDANVDSAAIALYVGFEDLIEPVLGMLNQLGQRMLKPVTVWIYGMKLSVIEEMSRRLEARGLPTYYDLETAIKALGVAAAYSKIKSSQ